MPSTTLLAEVTPGATRVAVVQDGRACEFYVEGVSGKSRIGNIYLGKVANIADGMQAAFVDVGLEHDVFLPVAALNLPRAVEEAPEEQDGGQEAAGDGASGPGTGGTEAGDAGAGGAGTGTDGAAAVRRVGAPPIRISDHLHLGQPVLIQIAKEAVGKKGPRGTLRLALPGRYLVMTPTFDNVGISRRIADPLERERLRAMGEALRAGPGGLILRTEAQGRTPEELAQDARELAQRWSAIEATAAAASVPALVHEEASLIDRVARDLFVGAVERMIIDDAADYARLTGPLSVLPEALRGRITLYTDAEPLFERHGIEGDYQKALERRVWLRSGGTIVIEETEALTSVDVNTGRFLGVEDLEDTAFKINLEAADAIARQIRLRNISGIIVIDFIDMKDEAHRRALLARLSDSFRSDRARTTLLDVTPLGLIQMSRQRLRPSLRVQTKETCTHCRGEGRVLSPPHTAARALREARKLATTHRGIDITVTVHPAVGRYLTEMNLLADLATRTGRSFPLRTDGNLHRDHVKVTAGAAPGPAAGSTAAQAAGGTPGRAPDLASGPTPRLTTDAGSDTTPARTSSPSSGPAAPGHRPAGATGDTGHKKRRR